MKTARIILIAALLVGGFYYFTTHHRGEPGEAQSEPWISRPTKVEITEAAGPQSFDAEEQVNIGVYKKVLPSVVNITSRTVAFDFFYGAVPEQGQGSGCIIDREGHILTNYHVVENAQ